jgi:hypothetical protein
MSYHDKAQTSRLPLVGQEPAAGLMVKFGSVYLLHEDAIEFIERLRDETARYGGPGAFEMTKSPAAWHEAGQAVVSATFGTVPTSVRIWRNRGDWEGHTARTLPVHVDD